MTARLYSTVPILAVAVLSAPKVGEPTRAPRHVPESSACAAVAPIRIEMTPTRRAGGARAVYEMRFSSSTFGWNKFIVFVTAESAADAESWSQEFYFSALSPSSRMHTMVGHGPFSSEPCLDPRN